MPWPEELLAVEVFEGLMAMAGGLLVAFPSPRIVREELAHATRERLLALAGPPRRLPRETLSYGGYQRGVMLRVKREMEADLEPARGLSERDDVADLRAGLIPEGADAEPARLDRAAVERIVAALDPPPTPGQVSALTARMELDVNRMEPLSWSHVARRATCSVRFARDRVKALSRRVLAAWRAERATAARASGSAEQPPTQGGS